MVTVHESSIAGMPGFMENIWVSDIRMPTSFGSSEAIALSTAGKNAKSGVRSEKVCAPEMRDSIS